MPRPDLSILRQFLLQQLGLNYTERQERELYRKLRGAAEDFGYGDMELFIDWLVQQDLSVDQTKTLADHLTIGETYFLRERDAYNYLEHDYLPRLIADRRAAHNKTLKLWSAGCASGEEPYTLAILLRQMLPDIEEWNIKLIATDINPSFLRKAKEGIYSSWSFRKAPTSFMVNNFDKIGKNRFQIKSEIQQMISFSFLNLIDDKFPSFETKTTAIDVIFCRNVMIYFSPEGITAVGNKFYDCLVSKGILIVSPVEVSSMHRSRFNLTHSRGCSVFDKQPKLQRHPSSLIDGDASYADNLNKTIAASEVLKKWSSVSSDLIRPKPLQTTRPTRVTKPATSSCTLVYKEALALYHSDALAEAEELLLHSLQADDRVNEEAHLLLSRIKANRGRWDEAMQLCLEVLKVNRVNADAHYIHAVILHEQGEVEEAVRAAEKTLFLEPKYALAHYVLGSIRLGVGDERLAAKHFSNLKRLLEKMDDNSLVDELDELSVAQLKSNIASLGVKL